MARYTGSILLSFAVLLGSIVVPMIAHSQSAYVYQTPSVVAPSLPQLTVDTTYPALSSSRTVRNVKASCSGTTSCYTSLQAAIDDARQGDEIVIDNSLTLTGPITLRSKIGSGWIVIRPADMSSLPKEGSRVSPSNSNVMPKIYAPGNNVPALQTEDMAHNYRLVGLEVVDAANDDTNVLVQLGTGNSYCSTPTDTYAVCDTSVLSKFATDIVLDRMYIHGNGNYAVKRGVGLDSKRSAIIDSYISNIHAVGVDTQALAVIWGPGPYKITNNYLEGAGENFLAGGDDPRVSNLIPSDIEFKNNYVYKPRSWKANDPSYGRIHWQIKNLFELKNAQRVLIDGNVFDGTWADAQSGYAILFTSRNQEGRCPWCVVTDVTFSNNIIRHAGSGISINGHDDHYPNNPVTNRIKVTNNLWDDINSASWGGSGWGILLDGGTSAPGPLNIEFSNNTFIQSGNAVMASSYYSPTVSTKPSTVFINNIFAHNSYGVMGDSTGPGNSTLSTYFPGGVFLKNALVGGSSSLYSNYSGNYFPSMWSDILTNVSGGNYTVVSTSVYRNAGTDGKDIGADIGTLTNRTAPVTSGNGPAPVTYPTPYATPYQTPAYTYPTPPTAPAQAPLTYPTPAVPDISYPVIYSFDLQPRTATSTVIATFTARDSGGSNIVKAELYRAQVDNVQCFSYSSYGCTWVLAKTINPSSALAAWSSSMADAPGTGQYYYGLHITDGAGNYSVESVPIQVTITGELGTTYVTPAYTYPTPAPSPVYTYPTPITYQTPAYTYPTPSVSYQTPASSEDTAATSTPGAYPTPTGMACALYVTPYYPTKSIKYGETGKKVIELQTYLYQKCYVSLSSITGYFGPLTQGAVRQFQCDNSLVCGGDEKTTGWGLVGPMTRTYIKTHQ